MIKPDYKGTSQLLLLAGTRESRYGDVRVSQSMRTSGLYSDNLNVNIKYKYYYYYFSSFSMYSFEVGFNLNISIAVLFAFI